MTTEIHHQREGVLVSWWHTCQHFSNPMFYARASVAEKQRTLQERRPCWECRNPVSLPTVPD